MKLRTALLSAVAFCLSAAPALADPLPLPPPSAVFSIAPGATVTRAPVTMNDHTVQVPIGILNPTTHSWTPLGALSEVASNAALLAYGGNATHVHRAGFYAAGDGGAADYVLSAAPCSAPDNGAQVPALPGGCWIMDAAALAPNVLQWGARSNGSDATAEFQAALAAFPGGRIDVPSASFFSATGVVVADAVLHGTAFEADDPTHYSGGSRLQCPINLPTPCLTVGGGDVLKTGRADNLVVQGLGNGRPSVGIGVKVDGPISATLHDVMSYRFADAYYWKAYNQNGLGTMATRIYSGRVSDAHLVVDSWPELKISQSRFGVDGTGDLGAATYVRFKSANYTNGAAGANTFDCVECQFNEGVGGQPVNHWIEFVSLASPGFPQHDVEIYRFTNSHIENVKSGLYSDASWNTIVNFGMDNCLLATAINGGTGPLFALDPATTMRELRVSNSRLLASVALTGSLLTAGLDNSFTNNFVNGAFTADNGGAGGHLAAFGNLFNGGLSISGAGWYGLALGGNEAVGSYSISPTTLATSSVVANDTGHPAMHGGDTSDITAEYNATAGNRVWKKINDANGALRFQACTDDQTACADGLIVERSGQSILAVLPGGPVQYTSTTVGLLPACNANTKYYHMFVGDAASTTFYAVAAGGGALPAPVFCDGAQWRVGG